MAEVYFHSKKIADKLEENRYIFVEKIIIKAYSMGMVVLFSNKKNICDKYNNNFN